MLERTLATTVSLGQSPQRRGPMELTESDVLE